MKQMPIPHCSCLLLVCLLGCGGTANVSGTVTYDGKAVERGKIRFQPLDDKGELDGKGLIVGVDISKGNYKAMDVPLGKKKVAIHVEQIAGQPAAPAGTDKFGQKQAVDSLIPPEATKDVRADITQANQTADFHLKKPQDAAATTGKK
jgi:hypothetical protein